MRKPYILIALLIFQTFTEVKSQTVSEVAIFNSLLDTLYNINLCVKIIRPPYYKCCNQDTLYGDELVECCKQSSVPQKYRVYCANCLNEQELDSLDLIMLVNNSLSKLRVSDHKSYLLNQIPRDSKFYEFVEKFKETLKPRAYSYDSLRQRKIRFITKETFDIEKRSYRYGKYGKQLFLGYFEFSRIFFDKDRRLGIFEMNWVGGGLCGYDAYILIYYENGVWKMFKRIIWRVY